MRTMLQVLMRTLALFLRNCADFLFRHAEPVAAVPAMEAVRPPGPPQDWLRRVNPPPPAHWVELVRRRAPRLLSSSPDPRLARSVEADPQFRGPERPFRSPPSVPSGPRPAPMPARDRKDGAAALLAPRPRALPTAAEAGPRRLRVVTSLQETPRPLPMPEPASAPPSELPEPPSAEAEFRPPPTPKRPTLDLFPRLIKARIPVRNPEPAFPSVRPALAGSLEAAWERPPFGDRDPESVVPSAPGRSPETLSWPGRAASRTSEMSSEPSREDRCRTRTGNADDSVLPNWPELPAVPEADVAEECLALVREQRRLDARDAEQRGKPWNA